MKTREYKGHIITTLDDTCPICGKQLEKFDDFMIHCPKSYVHYNKRIDIWRWEDDTCELPFYAND